MNYYPNIENFKKVVSWNPNSECVNIHTEDGKIVLTFISSEFQKIGFFETPVSLTSLMIYFYLAYRETLKDVVKDLVFKVIYNNLTPSGNWRFKNIVKVNKGYSIFKDDIYEKILKDLE